MDFGSRVMDEGMRYPAFLYVFCEKYGSFYGKYSLKHVDNCGFTDYNKFTRMVK